jgi:hypothetical protein
LPHANRNDDDEKPGNSKLQNIYRPQHLPRYSAKHSKSFSLIDRISLGVDRMQRNFESMRKQIEAWQKKRIDRRYCQGCDLRRFWV